MKDFKLRVLEWLMSDSEVEKTPITLSKEIDECREYKGHDYDDYLGKNVFIRTVTNFYTGKVEKTTKTTMTLSSACWIADTGRFNEAMISANFSEVEPYQNDIKVSLLSFEDITEIPKLPSEVK